MPKKLSKEARKLVDELKKEVYNLNCGEIDISIH